MRPSIYLLLAVAAGAVGLYCFLGDNSDGRAHLSAEKTAAPVQSRGNGAGISAAVATSTNGVGTSPFDRAVRQEQAELIKERKTRMASGGYSTPEEYFSMHIRELATKARAGDIYALLQLGDRYYYESQDAQFEDGFEFDHPPQVLGKAYLEAAATAGHGEVLNRLVAIYRDEGNREQMAAWLVFAERIGQPLSRGLAVPPLTASERLLAQRRAEELTHGLAVLQ